MVPCLQHRTADGWRRTNDKWQHYRTIAINRIASSQSLRGGESRPPRSNLCSYRLWMAEPAMFLAISTAAGCWTDLFARHIVVCFIAACRPIPVMLDTMRFDPIRTAGLTIWKKTASARCRHIAQPSDLPMTFEPENIYFCLGERLHQFCFCFCMHFSVFESGARTRRTDRRARPVMRLVRSAAHQCYS